MKTYTAKEVEELFNLFGKIFLQRNEVNQFLKDKGITQQLEVGKWYKRPLGTLICFTKCSGLIYGYGFDPQGDWINEGYAHGDLYKEWTEATHEEVEKALIKEAKKRKLNKGYKRFKTSICSTYIKHHGDGFSFENNHLQYNGTSVFNKGRWAEAPDEPIEMTVEEIAEKLGHEVKIVK